MRLSRLFPWLEWGRGYSLDTFTQDAVAAVIVTIMLIPQSLAYAMLAGLPPQIGLYASILPLVAYAVFGTSRTLAVGPVAVLSLMTFTAASRVAAPGSPEYLTAALVLAVLSGAILFALGLLRLGFIANFLSHPVISGFITASGIIIAASQLKHLLGIPAEGHNLPELLGSIAGHLPQTNVPTLVIGASALVFLFWVRGGLEPLLVRAGMQSRLARIAARGGPVIVVVAATVAVAMLGLDAQGVRIVGDVPDGLPRLAVPAFDAPLWGSLMVSAFLISLIGFVESVSVAQTLAAKRRQRIDPDQELLGLGAASLAAGLSGGYPVTGGFARSAVNFDAGAQTPAAGMLTALGIAITAMFFCGYLYYLPTAVLAATIVVAVLSLVDFGAIVRTWQYSRADFAAIAATIVVTLLAGVELGVSAGVALSLLLHLYHTSRPHYAIVGQVPGTEHFRNVKRHQVRTSPTVLTLRVDESLYFANARFLEDTVNDLVAENRALRHVVLMCPAVNYVDASALESLEAINHRLADSAIQLHLSEVKGPVMDRLKRTDFLQHLTGKLFLSQYEAIEALDPDCLERKREAAPARAENDVFSAEREQGSGGSDVVTPG